VKTVIGMDFSGAALGRFGARVRDSGLDNVRLVQGDMTRIPLRDRSVDKVVCLSVLQYLDDGDARRALREAARIAKPGGVIVLHVKNLSSLYLSSLWLAKQVKRRLGMATKIEHVRPYRWYVRELRAVGVRIEAYNSFNVLVVEGLPARLVDWLRRFELRHRHRFVLRHGLVRRHGAELKIRATVVSTVAVPRTG
jgi:SAM-dependent methyltransferase